VPAKNSVISKAAHNRAQVLWLDWKLKLGVTIDYPKPESIGGIAWRTPQLLPTFTDGQRSLWTSALL
jgi:hypothetical protein